jgi:phosphoserine/homoserine phosphotransferase
MHVVCLDLEGVLIPEIWINVAKKTGIEELMKTTRDEPDYEKLMKYRLEILENSEITIDDIQEIIRVMDPLDGAVEFLIKLQQKFPVIILSDTFSQFSEPIIDKLHNPTLFCHTLLTSDSGIITGWKIRLHDHKRKTVEHLKSLNFKVVASGDSYNDISMLEAANFGILFRPPNNVIDEFPQFPIFTEYDDILSEILAKT